MRKLWLVVLTVLLVAGLSVPASAITRGGQPDGDGHPYVGLMVATVDGEAAWRCSGALVSSTLYVTAGHCVAGADGVNLWFQTTLEPDRAALGYPVEGQVTGTPHADPRYLDEAFFLFDLGVVVLDEPVQVARYASLPEVGAVDAIPRGRKAGTVTVVGYGLQDIVLGPAHKAPIRLRGDLTRYRADVMVVDTRGVAGLGPFTRAIEGAGSFLVSGDAKHGGICFGDSGGPALRGDTIVGVNSFVLNANCAGVGGIYRIDKVEDLTFISRFLD
jgi:hypothetical protein